MKCPRCQTDNYEGAKYCIVCGLPLPKEKSKFIKAFRAFLHALFYVLIMLGCQYAVTSAYMMSLMMGSLVSGVLDENTLMEITDKVLAQTVMISLISNLLVILIICLSLHLRRKNPIDELGLRRVNSLRLPTFAVFGVALNVFVSTTLSLLPLPESMIESFEKQYSALDGNANIIIEILSIAVITGITEEIVFRGLVNSRLSRGMNTVITVLLSSVLFGLAHGTPIAIVYATLLGVVFSLMYYKFHSVIPSIICHVCFNATSYLLEMVDGSLTFMLYAGSIFLILFCVYRIFIRRPTFYDYVLDTVGEHTPRDDTEREIIAEVRRLQESDEKITPEELDRLAERWEENEKKGKRK